MSLLRPSVRQLTSVDEKALHFFLAQHPATSMLMRSNLERAGTGFRGEAYQCEYWGSFSNSGIEAAVAHAWNGNLLIEGRDGRHLSQVIDGFIAGSTRPLIGILGGEVEVSIAKARMGISDTHVYADHFDPLMHLDLNDRSDVFPTDHADHQWEVIPASQAHRDLLFEWEAGYTAETGLVPPASMEERWKSLERRLNAGVYALLLRDGQPVAKGGITARVADCVQIGGMWTPPPFRRRGYARYLLSERLRSEEEKGVTQSVLFAANDAATSAYTAVGYKRIGVYRLLFLRDPMSFDAESKP